MNAKRIIPEFAGPDKVTEEVFLTITGVASGQLTESGALVYIKFILA